MKRYFLATILAALACGDKPDAVPPLVVERHSGPEALSLLGNPLNAPPLADSTRLLYELNWQTARAQVDSTPNDADAIIWLGRRTAYLGRYREAIDVFSAGIQRHPEDARMFRHRGHRYITLRKLDEAIADLGRAVQLVVGRQDEVEPDGIPNARNIPTSTLQFNVWYHLGLAQYLKGDFETAAESYKQALAVSNNPDMSVATRNWLYLSLRRAGRTQEAAAVLEPVATGMDVIENESYYRLLLMYKRVLPVDSLIPAGSAGAASVQDATVQYGAGAWHLINGRTREARELFSRIVEGSAWPAFGHVAAEAELARTPR
jgi:tetratricopeptide (TPR) repeat protein